MLNQALDVAYWRRRLASDGRVQIPDFLQLPAARTIHHWLERKVPWQLAVRGEGRSRAVSAEEYAAMGEAERHALLASAADEAKAGFSFAYESYQMITAYLDRRDPGLELLRVTEFLNAPPFLEFARQITGDRRIAKADCQTCSRKKLLPWAGSKRASRRAVPAIGQSKRPNPMRPIPARASPRHQAHEGRGAK